MKPGVMTWPAIVKTSKSLPRVTIVLDAVVVLEVGDINGTVTNADDRRR